ncbi:MAG TPA: DUF4920 domain-containing protein [Bacteroidetes bacterium]|jgi:hypothetical protein|nr:DUF4920 domain-containing protein [Bacteroidota bacterium]
MKKISFLFIIAASFIACNNLTQSEETQETVAGRYGDSTWTTEVALTGEEMMDSLAANDSVYVTVSGNIKAACQAKGCWMSMDIAGNEMFVKFKDYSFFVPKNSAEHNATIRGWAYLDTVSVKDQLEYAKDAEATKEEINAITAPKIELTFTAEGVIID